jgi:hypothetical protein
MTREVGVRRAYAFSGSWTVQAARARVQHMLVDLERYPQWWPQVLAVASLGSDDARALSVVAALHVRPRAPRRTS